MKYIAIPVFIAILIGGCSGSGSTEPETPPTLSLKSGNVRVSEGETIPISLELDLQDQPIFGISIRIDYLPAVISFNDSTDFYLESFFGYNAVSFVKSEGNSIYLAFTRIQGQGPVDGAGTLCTLVFTAESQGAVNLEVPSSELHFYNAKGEPFDISDLVIKETEIRVQ